MRSQKINKNTKDSIYRLLSQFERFKPLKSTVRLVEIPTAFCHYDQQG